MNRSDLKIEDARVVDDNLRMIAPVIAALKKATAFKLGDYLVAYQLYRHTGQKVLMVNSYQAPVKWKVVFVDEIGMSYVKTLNNKGNPQGQLIPVVNLRGSPNMMDMVEFELDPEYVDSVIVDSQDQYAPSLQHEQNLKIRKEIVEHNKSIKIKTSNVHDIIALFAGMSAGETYWFSSKNGMTITDVALADIPKEQWVLKRKHKRVHYIAATLSNGKEVVYKPWDFIHKNLYKSQPRSFNELKNPI